MHRHRRAASTSTFIHVIILAEDAGGSDKGTNVVVGKKRRSLQEFIDQNFSFFSLEINFIFPDKFAKNTNNDLWTINYCRSALHSLYRVT